MLAEKVYFFGRMALWHQITRILSKPPVEDIDLKMFHMCWALSDGSSKLIPIDKQPNHQIVHLFRLGKANGATNQPLDPGPEIDVIAPLSLAQNPTFRRAQS